MKRRYRRRKPLSECGYDTRNRERIRNNLSKGLNRYGLKIEEYWVDDDYVIDPELEWKMKTPFGVKVFKFPEPVRPVVHKKKTVKGYYIAENGNLYSSFKGGGKGIGKQVTEGREVFDYLLKLSPSTSKMHCYLHLKVPPNFYDYEYRNTGKGKRQTVSVQVHQLVMQTWRPVRLYPPEKIAQVWDKTPEEVKDFISDCLFINHIDHDPKNNHVDNLEYCTPMHNAREAVKHWGGNNANKREIMESRGEVYIGYNKKVVSEPS